MLRARTITLVLSLLLAIMPAVSYALACAAELGPTQTTAAATMHQLQAEPPCPYAAQMGHAQPMEQEATEWSGCCLIISAAAPPSVPAQDKQQCASAEPEPEDRSADAQLHAPALHPRGGTGPPPPLPRGALAGTSTYLLVSPRLRL